MLISRRHFDSIYLMASAMCKVVGETAKGKNWRLLDERRNDDCSYLCCSHLYAVLISMGVAGKLAVHKEDSE